MSRSPAYIFIERCLTYVASFKYSTIVPLRLIKGSSLVLPLQFEFTTCYHGLKLNFMKSVAVPAHDARK